MGEFHIYRERRSQISAKVAFPKSLKAESDVAELSFVSVIVRQNKPDDETEGQKAAKAKRGL